MLNHFHAEAGVDERRTPFTIASGTTTVTGLFDGTFPLDVGPRSRAALVTLANSPVEVPEGALTGCDVSFATVRTS